MVDIVRNEVNIKPHQVMNHESSYYLEKNDRQFLPKIKGLTIFGYMSIAFLASRL